MEPLPGTLQPRAKPWPLSTTSHWDYLISQGPELGWWRGPVNAWFAMEICDLVWGHPFLKCWLTLQLPPFPFSWLIFPSGIFQMWGDQTGLLLELDLLQEAQQSWCSFRINADPRGAKQHLPPQVAEAESAHHLAHICLHRCLISDRKSNANALGRKPGWIRKGLELWKAER